MNVFISYSQKDTKFVNKLRAAFVASDINVIIDVESAKVGDPLQAFLERSVRETDFTIAVISKHSLQSVWGIAEALETLMYEHIEGRKKFLPIYIDRSFLDDALYLDIIAQVDKSIATLKELTVQAIEQHLGTAHFDQKRERFITLRNHLDKILKKLGDILVADFSSEAKFVANLPKLIDVIKQAQKAQAQSTSHPLSYLAPFQAPPLPEHFIPRPEVTNTLKARLLLDSPVNPGILVISAIHGPGGIGKTTIAKALAHDPEVRKRFPDGILWIELGQQPDILSLLSDRIINGLKDYKFRPTTIEAASTHLRTLLQDKALLLIVDDVWQPEHAKHFKVGGPYCQVLITIRRADVADEVGAELHQMDVMTPAQAINLLAARLGKTAWEEAERTEALLLAEAVGYLPLALELAAVRVIRGVSWTELRQALEQEIANLEALESSPRKRRRGETRLEACFNLSLNALRQDDEQAWEAFLWLGVLPEDVRIAAPMVTTLWNVAETDATDILELLWNDALLRSAPKVFIREKEWSSYRLHDLLHDFARRLLITRQPQGVGLFIEEAHAKLLERYKLQTKNGLWHTLPDDGYIHDHLIWHFQQASQEEQIHTLLREETIEGRNGWHQAREQLRQTAGFLADIRFAWERAETEKDISRQCRYALMISSVNSIAMNLPPNLLIALVEKGVWRPIQGLTYAYQIPEPGQRVETIIGLIPQLSEPLKENALREALIATQTIRYLDEWAEVQAKVALHLPKPLRENVLKEILTSPHKILDVETRTKAFINIAHYLPNSLKVSALHEALKTVQKVEKVSCRARLLVEIIPNLSGSLLDFGLKEVLTTAQAIKDPWDRSEIMAGLAPYLSESLLQETLGTVKIIKNSWTQAKVLSALAPHLSIPLLQEALSVGQVIEHSGYRAEAVMNLSPFLSKPLLKEALTTVQKIEDRSSQNRALSGILPRLAELGEPEEALEIIQTISDEVDWAEVLVKLIPHLPKSFLQKVLEAIQRKVAKEIDDEMNRDRVLLKLIPYLSKMISPEELLEMIKEIKTGPWRTEALSKIVFILPKSLLEKAILVVQTIDDTQAQVSAIAELVPHIAQLGEPNQALVITQLIENSWNRTTALSKMIPHLQQPQRTDVLRQVVLGTQLIKDKFLQAYELMKLVLRLTEWGNLEDALITARTIETPWAKAEALFGVIPYLPISLRADILREVMTIAHRIEDTSYQADILARVVPYLAELGNPEEALRTTQSIKEPWAQANALAAIVPRLAESGNLEQALRIARGITEKEARSKALSKMIPHLPEFLKSDIVQEIIVTIQTINALEGRVRSLMGLIPYLSEPLKEAMLREMLLMAIQAINETENSSEVEALIEAIPPLPNSILSEILLIAQRIEDVFWRNKFLVRLIPYLSEPLKTTMLQSTLASTQEIAELEAQAEILGQIALLLIELPYSKLVTFWQKLLKNLSYHVREDFLLELSALTSVIAKLGGKEAIAETIYAIQDVGRWWP